MSVNFSFAIFVVAIFIAVISMYCRTKHCCGGMRRHISELYNYPYANPGYAAPGSDEAAARMYQQGWLPPSDDISESGGSYEMLSGDGPKYTAKEDPFIDKKSYLLA